MQFAHGSERGSLVLDHPDERKVGDRIDILSSLAARDVSASTQNPALSAILFLYDVILGARLPWMRDIVRALR